ncbi:MAG TPA: LuxR C-terminal-related transcriptional regulator [Acidimicrobiales bacterium]|nr:LuxR C-terminal-related transcriptional regulator [Acidimicrobiales bacterium]
MGSLLDEGREAFDRQQWGDAYRRLSTASQEHSLAIDDLDRLATAAYLIGRDEESFELWASGHQSCLEAGEVTQAVRFAVRLANGLGFKGDVGRASGWVRRARRLLEDAGFDGVEPGYLDHVDAFCRIFEEGDVVAAHGLFARAAKVGHRFEDRELLTLARIGEGRCLIYLGDVAEGVALLDEAMVSVEAREISPVAVGDAYCTVIDACHELFDLRRSHAWTKSFSRWCDAQPDLVLYRGNCLLHRAEVMQLTGAWSDALVEADSACRRLAEPVNLLTLGAAHYRKAELHRLRGQFTEAEEHYASANEVGCDPQPGLAMLRLAQGRLDAADASIRRVLGETEGAITRGRVLAPYAEIVLAGGDAVSARAAADELTSVAAELGSPFLRAQAAHVKGAALLAEGDPSSALVSLRQAWNGWKDLETPYEGARTRVLIAAACRALGDHDGAEMESRAAAKTFRALGAACDLAILEKRSSPPDRRAPGGLTDREVEVLALVAHGKTNREIGQQLFISEKTVASHVTHILTKLGLPSRAAATAYAYEQELV